MARRVSNRVPVWCLSLAGLLLAVPAAAQVALVEDVDAPSLEFQVMDLLYEGDELALAEGERITLSYFESCAVEEITGGTVTVGMRESELTGGRIKRKTVQCGGSGVVLSAHQEGRSEVAGVLFRSGPDDGSGQPVMLYARAPIFTFSAPVDELVIERLDPHLGDPLRLAVSGNRLDLADSEVRLVQGGRYRATAGDKTIEFKVSEGAPETSRLISRFIGF